MDLSRSPLPPFTRGLKEDEEGTLPFGPFSESMMCRSGNPVPGFFIGLNRESRRPRQLGFIQSFNKPEGSAAGSVLSLEWLSDGSRIGSRRHHTSQVLAKGQNR